MEKHNLYVTGIFALKFGSTLSKFNLLVLVLDAESCSGFDDVTGSKLWPDQLDPLRSSLHMSLPHYLQHQRATQVSMTIVFKKTDFFLTTYNIRELHK